MVKLSTANRRVVAFGAVMFASSLMNNVFVTYYLDLYRFARIDPTWFYVGQLLFALWNAVNDPLFGWISDNINVGSRPEDRRILAIRYGGALWALAFLFVWFPPSAQSMGGAALGLHFAAALCIYDSMLSLVEVNHHALLAEMTVSASERARALSSSAAFAALGSLSSYGAQALWLPSQMGAFRAFCLGLSALAFAVFWACSAGLTTPSTVSDNSNAAAADSGGSSTEAPSCKSKPKARVGFREFVSQLFKQRNFVIFLVLAFVQQFDCTFEKTFMNYSISSVSTDTLSTHTRSFLISLSFFAPHVMTITAFPLLTKFGVYTAIVAVLSVRTILLVAAWLFGATSIMSMCLLLVANRVASEGLCRLFPMVSSDLVDEDSYIHNRDKSLSASLVGMVFFFSKFSQSIAPAIGFAWLPRAAQTAVEHPNITIPGAVDGPRSLAVDSATPVASAIGGGASATGIGMAGIDTRAWYFTLAVASACVLVQAVLWSQFTLRGARLKLVKMQGGGGEEEAGQQQHGSPTTGPRRGARSRHRDGDIV